MNLSKILSSLLRTVCEKLDAGTTDLSEDDMMHLVDEINKMVTDNNHMSKYQASKYIGVSRSTFDRLVSLGVVPKGMKLTGLKELMWKKHDLDECLPNVKKTLRCSNV